MLKHGVHEQPEFHELEPISNEEPLQLRLMYDPDKNVPKQPPIDEPIAKIVKAKRNTIHCCEMSVLIPLHGIIAFTDVLWLMDFGW